MSRTAVIHLITEFGPVLAFFITGQLHDFYTATAVLMVATVLASGISWVYERRLPIIPIISALFVLVGGAVTLIFSTPDAIIFADSLYFFTMAFLIAWGRWRGQDVLQKLFNGVFAISDEGWRILSWRWFWYLFLAGCANEYVRLTASADFWIEFKFYKNIVMASFATYQLTLSRRYRLPHEANAWGLRLRRLRKPTEETD